MGCQIGKSGKAANDLKKVNIQCENKRTSTGLATSKYNFKIGLRVLKVLFNEHI